MADPRYKQTAGLLHFTSLNVYCNERLTWSNEDLGYLQRGVLHNKQTRTLRLVDFRGRCVHRRNQLCVGGDSFRCSINQKFPKVTAYTKQCKNQLVSYRDRSSLFLKRSAISAQRVSCFLKFFSALARRVLVVLNECVSSLQTSPVALSFEVAKPIVTRIQSRQRFNLARYQHGVTEPALLECT